MEKRDVLIKCKVKKKDENGKFYDLEKQETFIIEEYGKTLEKTVNFKLDDKEHKIIITLTPEKGMFGDKIFINGMSQGKFMPEQEPVEVIKYSAKFKKNPWRTEGKILVGFVVISVISLIIAFFWSRRKRKV